MGTDSGARLLVHSIFVLCLFVSLFLFLAVPAMLYAQGVANSCENGRLLDAEGNDVGACESDGTFTEAPTNQAAVTLSNDGIFGCMGQGARVQNVGTRAAIGGVYVPVNDAAVTLNTGFLVYKECILDGMARKIAESGTAELGRQNLNAITTGRNGGPQYVVNPWEELRQQNDAIFIDTTTRAGAAICSAFGNSVRTTSARAYMASRSSSSGPIVCTRPAQDAPFWVRLLSYQDQQNNAYGAAIALDGVYGRLQAANEYNQRERWIMNNGFYDVMDTYDDPLGGRILTPGYIIARSLEQVVGSGYRQLESATEIDQVVSNLFGGLTTQLISDTRGLVGLTQPVNGQPSYVDRMVAQTSASVRQQASNAALSIIGAARQIEADYRQAKEGLATALSNSIEQLRNAERQCWALIIPEVQQVASAQNVQLQIATSTRFSQPIVDEYIAPVATTTIAQIRTSDATIATLNQLISSVSNSASQANQQQALLRLDTMVANQQLRTATDASNAASERDSIVTALTKLVEDTVTAWGDSTDPNVGWCNVNNQDVITRWLNEWRV